MKEVTQPKCVGSMFGLGAAGITDQEFEEAMYNLSDSVSEFQQYMLVTE